MLADMPRVWMRVIVRPPIMYQAPVAVVSVTLTVIAILCGSGLAQQQSFTADRVVDALRRNARLLGSGNVVFRSRFLGKKQKVTDADLIAEGREFERTIRRLAHAKGLPGPHQSSLDGFVQLARRKRRWREAGSPLDMHLECLFLDNVGSRARFTSKPAIAYPGSESDRATNVALAYGWNRKMHWACQLAKTGHAPFFLRPPGWRPRRLGDRVFACDPQGAVQRALRWWRSNFMDLTTDPKRVRVAPGRDPNGQWVK